MSRPTGDHHLLAGGMELTNLDLDSDDDDEGIAASAGPGRIEAAASSSTGGSAGGAAAAGGAADRGLTFSKRDRRQRARRMFFLSLALLAVIFGALALAFVLHGQRRSADPEAPAWETSVRLPAGLVPSSYDVELRPDMVNLDRFEGNVTIRVRATQPGIGHVVLHAGPLVRVTSSSVQSVPRAGETPLSVPSSDGFAYAPHQFWVIPLAEALDEGFDYDVRLGYEAPLDDSLAGLYRSRYTDAAGAEHALVTTQFEPTDARRCFPGFDEPAFKANFTVRVVHPAGWTALGNMPVASTEAVGGGLVRTSFEQSPPMSTYLVAVVVSQFGHVSGNTARRNMPVSIWSPADEVDQTRFALEVTIRCVDAYEEYFGIDFALPKMDLVAIPDFAAGAMENWGLITFRQVDLLFSNDTSSVTNRLRVAEVVAHELGHQWFGDLVTMSWWSDLWLNEGFATWAEHLVLDTVFPDWDMWGTQFLPVQQGALELDSLASSHPIHVDVSDPADVNSIFDTISYSKGASVLRMIMQTVSDDAFRAGLHLYLSTHRFGNAQSADLWDAIQSVLKSRAPTALTADLDVASMMSRWITSAGYPRLTVSPDGSVRQSAFLTSSGGGNGGCAGAGSSGGGGGGNPAGCALPPTDSGFWQVPVRSTSSSAPAAPADSWLSGASGRVGVWPAGQAPPSWLRANTGQWGFYRVEPQGPLLSGLIAQLRLGDGSSLAAPDRAGALNDLFALARSDTSAVTYADALSATMGLRNDSSHAVWAAADGRLELLRQLLESDPKFGALEDHVVGLLGPRAEQLATANWTDDDPQTPAYADLLPRMQRRLLAEMAAKYGHRGVLERARGLFAVFMADVADFRRLVSPDLRQLVWTVGVRLGGEAEWDALWSVFNTSTPSEQRAILAALAATRVPWLLARYLEYSLLYVRAQDVRFVVSFVATAGPLGTSLALSFVLRNFDQLRGHGSGSMIHSFDHVADREIARRIRDFFATNDAADAQRSVSQTLERIEDNAAWVDRNLPTLVFPSH